MPKQYNGLVYIIPGNPGLSKFYDEFIAKLKLKFPDWLYICGDHLGMLESNIAIKQFNQPDELPSYSLKQQVNHHAKELKRLWQIHASSTAPKVHIISHSMGSWLAQHVIPQIIDQVPVSKALLLTPTIRNISRSPNGKWVTPIFRTSWIDLAWIAANISYYLPTGFLKWLASNRLPKGVGKFAHTAAESMAIRPMVVYQMVSMAKEEMEVIVDDNVQEFWQLADQGRLKVGLYFSKNDHWVGDENETYLVDKYRDRKNVTVQVSTRYPHSFCLRHNDEMIEDLEVEFL